MVQMKMPTETKAIDRYLLVEYLQEENKRKKPFIAIKCRPSVPEVCDLHTHTSFLG